MKEGSSESLTIYTYTLENIVFHVKTGNGSEICSKLWLGNEIYSPSPPPQQDSCHFNIVYFVYNCGGNGCFNNSNRLLHVWNSKRHVQTFIRKLTVQPTTYFPDLENHKLYHVIDTFCFNCNSWSLPSNLVITTSITWSDHELQLSSVII